MSDKVVSKSDGQLPIPLGIPDDFTRPKRSDLAPANDLLSVFEDCHNHVYANEGLLKDRIFTEFIKLLMMKLVDERDGTGDKVNFYVTPEEYDAASQGLQSAFDTRLLELYAQVRSKYPSLFDSRSTLELKLGSLAYMVRALQQINLHKTPGDVKGQAFQTFTYRHQRGDRGEFFTPHPVVDIAIDVLRPSAGQLVVDPACGSGGFLIAAARQARVRDGVPINGPAALRLQGIEFNPDIARAATLRILFEGGSGDEIICADSLATQVITDGTVDVILTNPPFGSKGKIDNERLLVKYELAHRWKQTRSGWAKESTLQPGQAPEVLFIEKCIRLLRPGGRMAMVIPDGLLHNSSVGYVRSWIREHAEVLGVVSLPSETFIPYGTGIKTSLLFVQKYGAEAAHKTVFLSQINRIGYDVKGRTIFAKDNMGQPVLTADGSPAVNTDCADVARFAHAVVSGARPAKVAGQYTIPSSALMERLDVEFYLPEDKELIKSLGALGAVPLSELTTFIRGKDSFKNRPDAEIRYVAIADVDSRLLAITSSQVMSAHEAPSRAAYRLNTGDIITALSGASTGTPKQAVAIVGDEDDGVICSNGFAVLRDVKRVHPYYLAAYMRSSGFLRQVRRLMTGHAIPSISLEDLGAVLVPIPTPEMSKRVVAHVEELIELRHQAVNLGEEIGKAVDKALS